MQIGTHPKKSDGDMKPTDRTLSHYLLVPEPLEDSGEAIRIIKIFQVVGIKMHIFSFEIVACKFPLGEEHFQINAHHIVLVLNWNLRS